MTQLIIYFTGIPRQNNVYRTNVCLRVARVGHVQTIERHEGDFARQTQTVHFLQNHGARSIRVDNVMEQSDINNKKAYRI